jgi:hypothetical protein
MVGHVACIKAIRNGYKILFRTPEGKRPLGKHRRRWEYNIKTYIRKTVLEGVDWINQAQERTHGRLL